MPDAEPLKALETNVDRLARIDTSGPVSVGTILSALGRTGALPLLMLLGLSLVSPLSGIPLFTSCVGLIMALSAWQLFRGRNRVTLPAFLADRTISGARVEQGVGFLHKAARVIDRLTVKGRLAALTGGPARVLIAALIVCIGLFMPALELVPFSSSILGGAVMLLSLGMLARDGGLVIAGLALISSAVTLVVLIARSVAG